MTRVQLTDEERQFIGSYLPIGEYGPYPERLRRQFEGVIWRFKAGGQWRETTLEESVAADVAGVPVGCGRPPGRRFQRVRGPTTPVSTRAGCRPGSRRVLASAKGRCHHNSLDGRGGVDGCGLMRRAG
ncbi:hypothetical protein R8789_45620 [Streptomyces malaysiensis]|nr:hypothetical protein R8789_45620 [Streptomyces malaysiensis]